VRKAINCIGQDLGATLDFISGLLYGIVAMFGFGFEGYFLARLSRRVGGFKAAFWFQVAAVLIMAAMALFLFTRVEVTPLTLLIIIMTGLVSAIGIFSFSKGLEHGHISVVATIASAWGAVTAILGILFLGDKLTLFQSMCIALIVIGTILIPIKPKRIMDSFSGKRNMGVRYAVVTLATWGLYYFFLTYLVRTLGWFDSGFLATVATVAFLVIGGISTKSRLRMGRKELPLLLFITLLNLVAFFSYNLGVTFTYSSIVAPVSAASPLVIIVMAMIFLKEKLSHHQKIGIAMVLLGLVLLPL
jgi:drug/metabolite transporter (DMT)-like permease